MAETENESSTEKARAHAKSEARHQQIDAMLSFGVNPSTLERMLSEDAKSGTHESVLSALKPSSH